MQKIDLKTKQEVKEILSSINISLSHAEFELIWQNALKKQDNELSNLENNDNSIYI